MEIEGGRVIKWGSRAFQPDIFEEGVISDPQALSTAIKQLMSSSGINAGNTIASVSGLYSISRIIMVPTPVGDIPTHQAVMEVAGEVMPLSEEELYISWQAVAPGEGGYQVLVVAVPRDVVDSEMRSLRMAGVNVRMLNLKTMALAKVVNRAQALVLSIEPTTFDIVLIVNGVTAVMRTDAWQPDDLSVEDKAEHLAVALELTVGFHNSHNPNLPLDPATPLFITGLLSGDSTLMERLHARAGYPIESLEPPLQYPAHLPVSQYAVNIGLALKGTSIAKNGEQAKYSLPDINLLPEAYRPWKPKPRHVYSFLAIVSALALLFPLYQMTSDAMGETAVLKSRYNIINNELERRKTELTKQQPLKNAIAEYNAIVDMGGGFTEDLQVIYSKAEELGIGLQSVNHEGSKITISCQADDYISFRDYLTALEESGRFSTPIPPPEGYPYTKSGTIKLEPKTGE